MTSSHTSQLLRHVLATLAYRGGKVLKGSPPGFGEVSLGEGSRTAVETLAHIGDLFDWALQLTDGHHVWTEASATDWDEQVTRYFRGLVLLEEQFGSGRTLGFSEEKLFQGPLADALTHIGQLALMRRLVGSPVRGENYFKADIQVGRVGPDQPPPRYEFD